MNKEDNERIEKLAESMYFSPDEVLAHIRGATLEHEHLSHKIGYLERLIEGKDRVIAFKSELAENQHKEITHLRNAIATMTKTIKTE